MVVFTTVAAAGLTIASAMQYGVSATEFADSDQDPQRDEIQKYKGQIVFAGLAIDCAKPAIARQLLSETNPRIRGWEYGYLRGETNRSETNEKYKITNEGIARDVVFSPDGKRLIFGRGKNVVVWDFVNDKLAELVGHSGNVASVAIDPQGGKIASGGWDGKIIRWDLQTGKKVLEYLGHNRLNNRSGAHETRGVRDLCFSPDGRKIASTAFVNSPFVTEVEPELKIWSTETGETLNVLGGVHNRGRAYAILCVDFSPDGKLIAAGSFDNKIRIWNTAIGNEIRTIQGHRNNVLGVAFSPCGSQLASASTDGTVAVWEVKSGKEFVRMRSNNHPVFSVRYSHDGKRIISGCCDQNVKIWHSETGLELLSLREPGSFIRSVAISNDGQWIAAERGNVSRRPGVTVWKSEIADR